MSQRTEEPRIVQTPSITIAGLQRYHRFDGEMSANLARQWREFVPMMTRLAHARGRVGYGLCFDTADKAGFDYLTGIEVTTIDGLEQRLKGATVPAGTYAVFPHRDHVSKLSETVRRAFQWLPASGHAHHYASGREPTLFERYGERFDPQTGLGDIDVFIPVKA